MYQQETNRYHAKLMLCAESLFTFDSHAALNFLSLPGDSNSEFYPLIYGMRSIDSYLDDFMYSPIEKYNFAFLMAEQYHKEFGGGRGLRAQLNAKYKQNKKAVVAHMNYEHDDENGIEEAIDQLKIRSASGKEVTKEIPGHISQESDKQTLMS